MSALPPLARFFVAPGTLAVAIFAFFYCLLERSTSSGSAAPATSLAFVAPAALEDGLAERLGERGAVRRDLIAQRDVRALTKADLLENSALPRIEVDPDTFTVRIDGEVVEPAPAQTLPLTQRYFLF